MRIKFIKEYKAFGDLDLPRECVRTDYSPNEEVDAIDEVAQWLIDNGFAEKVKEQWPCYGDKYWYVVADGVPMSNRWEASSLDFAMKTVGNRFKTEESAQRFIDYLNAVETVRHDDGFMKISRKNNCSPNGYGIFRYYLNGSVISEEIDDAVKAGEFYFDTEEHAIASSKKHPNEWETILNYDWSKE